MRTKREKELEIFIDNLDSWLMYFSSDGPKEDKRILFLFKALHSHNMKAPCYEVHKDWKEETDKEIFDRARKFANIEKRG